MNPSTNKGLLSLQLLRTTIKFKTNIFYSNSLKEKLIHPITVFKNVGGTINLDIVFLSNFNLNIFHFLYLYTTFFTESIMVLVTKVNTAFFFKDKYDL